VPKRAKCGVEKLSVLVGKIEEIGGRAESRGPKGMGDNGVKQEGANNIISSANDAFSFTILRRGVGVGHAKVNAMGQEERANGEVIKLAAIITLNSLDGDTKLCAHIGKRKFGEGRESIRLKA
jgi:hypothetical protein